MEEPDRLVTGLTDGIERWRPGSVPAVVRGGQLSALGGIHAVEVRRSGVQVVMGGGATTEQGVLLDGRAQTGQPTVQTLAGELAVELNRILTHQQHDHAVGATAVELGEHVREVRGAQRDVGLADHFGRGVLQGEPCRGAGHPREDIVVADHGPAPDAQLFAHPVRSGQQLVERPLAEHEDAGRVVAALVHRGVRVDDPASDPSSDSLAHRRDVPASDPLRRGHYGPGRPPRRPARGPVRRRPRPARRGDRRCRRRR